MCIITLQIAADEISPNFTTPLQVFDNNLDENKTRSAVRFNPCMFYV